MLKRYPIFPDNSKLNCNNGGIHNYDPYIFSDQGIIIDKIWWESLIPYIRQLIEERLDKFELGEVKVPHDVNDDSKELKILDQCYLDGFDYHIWYDDKLEDLPRDVQSVYMSKDVKNVLIKLHHHEEIDTEILDNFKDKIIKKMEPGVKYFMRLSATSGKNHREVKPMESIDEIMDNLVKNEIFVQREYWREKDTYLVLVPWNDKIEKRNEFRIFVRGGKLSGITQQWWSKLFNYTQEELETFEKAFENISFLNKIPYQDWIGDVYIDEGRCKLIEINPFGAQCGAGSGLFNWITDYDKLYGNGEIEFRYQSIINF